jgi:hypothetical protein
MGIMFVFMFDSAFENQSIRESNFSQFENITDCGMLFSHYRQAIEFERDFVWHGYTEELYYEFQVKSKELKC